MGGNCSSSSSEAHRHHRENEKNRNNPTESLGAWQEKMLLDIGSDPLAVIRDFPRMTVYVGTEQHHNYIPGNAPASKVNPLAPNNAAATPTMATAAAAAANASGGASPTSAQLSSGAKKGRPPRPGPPKQYHEGNSQRHHHHLRKHGGGLHQKNSSRSDEENEKDENHPANGGGGVDCFAARMKRVKETVLLLSELCGEKATYGKAFEEAWNALVRGDSEEEEGEEEAHGGHAAGVAEATAASASPHVMGDLVAPAKGVDDEVSTRMDETQVPISALKRSRNAAITLDVHQVLLNACLASGMLALMDESVVAIPGNAGRYLHETVPSATSRGSPGAVPQGGENQSGPGAFPSTPGASSAPKQYNSSSASISPTAFRGSRSATAPAGAGSAVLSAPAKYQVCCATYHLMQFATQGVVFFPSQRLKHVLWVPWASHMQDVSWVIHISVKDATPADLIALKQQQQQQHPPSPSALFMPDGNRDTAGQSATGGAMASNSSAVFDDRNTAAALLPSTDLKKSSPMTDGLLTPDSQKRRKIIVVEHVQTGRHYVDDGQQKRLPRYELDWACTLRIDLATLQEHYLPFQKKRVGVAFFSHSISQVVEETTAAAATAATMSHDGEVLGTDLSGCTMVTNQSANMSTIQEDMPQLGIRTCEQPALVKREVVAATVEVIAARVESPPHTLCWVPAKWQQRKDELAYILQHQYHVSLDVVPVMRPKSVASAS